MKKMTLVKVGLGVLIFLISCKSLPKTKLKQAKIKATYEVENDTLSISVKNTVHAPIQFGVSSKKATLEEALSQHFPMIVPGLTDSILLFPTNLSKKECELSISVMFGNPNDRVENAPLSLPFPEGRSYRIIQGYQGQYSHNSDYSKYAIDFALKEGDTVCAAADGYVIGVIEGYEYGGKLRKWREYANFITLFHPETNLFTQYVHLTHQGSLVEVGDTVKAGQPIGLSGLTGYTDVEHLHFNVLRSVENNMVSVPIDFMEGYSGKELIKGKTVEKK